MEGNWNYFVYEPNFLKTFKMQGNEKQWPTLNMSQCHVPPFLLVCILSRVLLWALWNTEVEGQVLFHLHSTPSHIPVLHWFILMEISVISHEQTQCKIYLAKMAHLFVYLRMCLSVYLCRCTACESLALDQGGIQALSSESAESSSLDCHQTQLELNLDV